jgi:hypothetical protein
MTAPRPRGRRSSRYPPAAVRLPRVVVLAVALAAASVGCSDDATSVGADEAAGVLADQFDLPDDAAGCLAQAFRDDAQARRAIGTEATPGDIGALNAAVNRCVPPAPLSTSVAGLMARNYSPAGPASDTQADCLEAEILALPREDQLLLITGPLNQQIAVDTPTNLAAGEIVRRLAEVCGLLGTRQPNG